MKIDAGVPFVTLLEDTVVSSRQQVGAFRDPLPLVKLFGTEDRCRARIDQTLHSFRVEARGFKNVQGSHDVDPAAERGVGRAEGDLQCSQMNDPVNGVFRHCAVYVLGASDVALDEIHSVQLVLVEQIGHALRLGGDVEDTGPVTGLDEILDHPGPEEALGAGNQKSSLCFWHEWRLYGFTRGSQRQLGRRAVRGPVYHVYHV